MAAKQKVFKLFSGFSDGLVGTVSEVEVSLSPGIPTFDIIGLCDASIRESRGRVKAALASCGFRVPQGHITVGISPAYMRKSGSSFDLAIALGILFVSGQIMCEQGKRIYAEGELSFDGKLKRAPGSAVRLSTQTNDYDYSFIPYDEKDSANCTSYVGMTCRTLAEVVNVFVLGGYKPVTHEMSLLSQDSYKGLDFSVLRGQEKASRAILIAASGRHNLLMMGSNGCGKSLAGHLIAGIMPPLNQKEICDVYKAIDSGLFSDSNSISPSLTRPYRIIHPGVSKSQIFGGTVRNEIGELLLANHGVLFADEICEFKSEVIESLRLPLEDHVINRRRDGIDYKFDASFVFVAAGNPCKCGQYYEGNGKCKCTPGIRRRYLQKLSGPFLDRIDLFTEMRSISTDSLKQTAYSSDKQQSKEYKEIVRRAWEIQYERYGTDNNVFNGTTGVIDADIFRISQTVLDYAADLSEKCSLSGRGFNRILRVARTIADIEGSHDVLNHHIAEAVMYRQRVDNG